MIKSVIETAEEIKLLFSNPIDERVSNPVILSSGIFREDLKKFIAEKYKIQGDFVLDMNFNSYLDIKDVFVINSKGETRWEHWVELVIQKDYKEAEQEEIDDFKKPVPFVSVKELAHQRITKETIVKKKQKNK